MSFGQNEMLNDESAIGLSSSDEISTEWGAWNTVLSAIYSWNPTVHIGIIGYEGTPISAVNVHREIAKAWGIPYYGIHDDINIPLLMENSGKIGIAMNPFAVKARRLAFQSYNQDGSVNMHPNLQSHIYRSKLIENFMRGI